MHALRTDSRLAASALTAEDASIRESADHSTLSRSVPPEIGTARGGGSRAFALVAEIDAAAREIVGRDLHDDTVAHAGADAELAHLARHIRENLVLVVERHAIIAVGQHLGDGAVEFEQLFLGHVFSPIRYCYCARWPAWEPNWRREPRLVGRMKAIAPMVPPPVGSSRRCGCAGPRGGFRSPRAWCLRLSP